MQLHEQLRFPKPTRNRGPVDIGSAAWAGSTYQIVTMKYQWWAFPHSTVSGVPSRIIESNDPDDIVALALGYRCECCNRVFFASELNDFIHECMQEN